MSHNTFIKGRVEAGNFAALAEIVLKNIEKLLGDPILPLSS